MSAAVNYRDIYKTLSGYVSNEFLSHSYPTNTDDMLRDAGVEVYGCDAIQTTHSALFVYLSYRVLELEKRIAKLEKA